MKTLTNILILVLSLTLISGCMPASFTKWKQNAPTTKKPSSVFQDSDGNPIPANTLVLPTTFTYHATPYPTVHAVSSAASATTTITPTLNGSLEGTYPWSAQGQSLAPVFSFVTDVAEQISGCPDLLVAGTISLGTYVSPTTGQIVFPVNLGTSYPSGEYCMKVRYKKPISTTPGYTYAYLYTIAKIWVLAPITELDYEQSTRLVLDIRDEFDTGHFTVGNTVTSTNTSAYTTGTTATGTGVITYFDSTAKKLYITRTTGIFKANQGLILGSGSISNTHSQFTDAIVSNVVNVFLAPTSTSTIPNINIFPQPHSALTTSNGVAYTVSTNAPYSQFLTFTGSTGTLVGFITNAESSPRTYNFTAQNAISSKNLSYQMLITSAGGGTQPTSLTYSQVSTASCTAKVKLMLRDISSGQPLSSRFTVGGKISGEGGGRATVRYIGTNYLYADMDLGAAAFSSDQKVDNTATYVTNEATIDDIIHVFEKGVAICDGQIVNTITPSGTAVNYSISPALPSGLGLTLDATTGTITGTPVDTTSQMSYTITAQNGSTPVSAPFKFLISIAPKGLSMTHQVLLTVDDSSQFVGGARIASSATSSPGSGVVREVIDSTHLLVDVENGTFNANDLVDKYSTYYDTRAVVSGVKNNTLRINYNNLAAPPTVDHIVISSTGAQAVVNYVDAVGGRAYLRLLKGTFKTADQICSASSALVSTSTLCTDAGIGGYTNTISIVNAPVLTIAGAPVFAGFFTPGRRITTNVGEALLVTENTPGVSFSALTESYLADIQVGDTVSDMYIFSNADRTINSVAHNHTFYIYQGQNILITPDLLQGENVTYSINNALPSGLSFSTTTGQITGLVTNSLPKTTYTLTAVSPMGTATHSFSIQSYRHFEIRVTTPNAPSQFIHREGEGSKVVACRVLENQITAPFNDVICMVESGELDLFKEGLKFEVFAGKGMCEKVIYRPYYFFKKSAGETDETVSKINKVTCSCTNPPGASKCAAPPVGLTSWYEKNTVPGVPVTDVTATACSYYHQNLLNPSTPLNCDVGSYTMDVYDYQDSTNTGSCSHAACATRTACEDGGDPCNGVLGAGTWTPDCISSVTTSVVECGGNTNNCIAGAIRSEYEDDEIKLGKRATVYDAFSGSTKPFTIKSPMIQNHSTNIDVANYTAKNSCGLDQTPPTLGRGAYKYFADNWESYTESVSMSTSPWGLDAFLSNSPYYEFNCTTSAEERVARIRVLVRDWDLDFNLNNTGLDIHPNPLDASFPNMDTLYTPTPSNNTFDWDNIFGNNDPGMSGCDTGAPVNTPGKQYGFPGDSL